MTKSFCIRIHSVLETHKICKGITIPLSTKLWESQMGNIWDLLFSNYMYNILIYDYGTENN